MLTLCWAAKGGSGTTVTVAGLALAHHAPTLLVDLAGDLPLVLGVDPSGGPGVADWLHAEAPAARLAALERELGDGLALLPRGTTEPAPSPRWRELVGRLAGDPRSVIVDAGTGTPPAALAAVAGQRLLVVRNCYLNLRAAVGAAHAVAPTACVLVEEPGRRLTAADVEHSLGVPVVAVVLLDPAIARATDAGLLLGRVPGGLRRPLEPLRSDAVLRAAA